MHHYSLAGATDPAIMVLYDAEAPKPEAKLHHHRAVFDFENFYVASEKLATPRAKNKIVIKDFADRNACCKVFRVDQHKP